MLDLRDNQYYKEDTSAYPLQHSSPTPDYYNSPLRRSQKPPHDPNGYYSPPLDPADPREQILPTPLTNNGGATTNAAAAACNPPPEIPADPLQLGQIQLHSWQLYTPETPVLDLRGKKVTSTLDLADTLKSYVYVPQTVIPKKNLHQMAEGKDKELTNLNKQLSDSDTLDNEPINPKLKTSVEERQYGTIPDSALATQAALSHTHAQANPTVECGPSHTKTVKKLTKE